MPGPFDTSHLRGFFSREVDDDATAAAINAAIRADEPIEAVKTVYIERCKVSYAGDPKTVTVFNAHEPFQYFRAPNQRQAQWFTPAEFFPDEYDLFSRGLEQVKQGIPIEELTSFLSPSKIDELKSLDIHTCESLAGLEGSRLLKLGPNGRALMMKAKAYLAGQKGTSETAELARELTEVKRQLAALTGGAKPAPAKTTTTAEPRPPAHLKGAARANWIKKNAAEAEPAPAPSPESPEGIRAMLEGTDEVDLRNMLEAYGVALQSGWTKKRLVDEMVKVNEKAARGLKATETEAA